MSETQISPLLSGLQSSDESTRLDAAERIARHPDRQLAAIELVKAASDDGEASTWIVEALENLGPPSIDSTNDLAGLLDSESSDVVFWAATLLGRLKEEAASATEVLVRVANRSDQPAARAKSIIALGEIGVSSEGVVATLKELCNVGNDRIARLAKEALLKLGVN